MSSRFRRPTSSATCRWRARSRGSRPVCLRRARRSRRFEIPLHVMQDDRQSEDLPLGSRGGIAIRHDFPVDGEYLIKVRLQRQYQDYLKGMGWPQQLDVRLDGKLLKRFTVGGEAQGQARRGQLRRRRRARLCRRRPEWEKYMQIGGDAGLEVRVPVDGGTARRRRVVRAGDVGAGRPAAAAAARPGHHERPGLHGLRERRRRSRSAVRTRVAGAGEGHARAAARFSSVSRRRAAEERACATKILSRMARLAYRRPVTNARRADAARVLRQRPARRRQFRRRHSVRARTDAGRSGLPAARPSRSGRRPNEPRVSPERSRSRVAAVVLPVEQHPRRSPARRWPSADS